MNMSIARPRIALAVCTMFVFSIPPKAAHPQSNSTVVGAHRYTQFCAACHGANGEGADKATALAANPDVMNRSDAELLRIVRDGTPAGMPPFAQIGDANIAAIIDFLRGSEESDASGGTAHPGSTTGDATAGEALFFGKAQCSTCHMMRGRGGFIAGNLTTYAGNRSANIILKAIIAPDSPLLLSSRVVNVTTKAGQTIRGVLRNEDGFNLVVQTEDGRFHFLSRDDLSNIAYTDHSLMPLDYGTRLTSKDLNDIVSFLVASSKNQSSNVGLNQ